MMQTAHHQVIMMEMELYTLGIWVAVHCWPIVVGILFLLCPFLRPQSVRCQSDGVRAAIIAPSVGTGSEEPGEVTVFFRVRPEDPLLKSNKKSLLWKYFAHFDTVYHPDK